MQALSVRQFNFNRAGAGVQVEPPPLVRAVRPVWRRDPLTGVGTQALAVAESLERRRAARRAAVGVMRAAQGTGPTAVWWDLEPGGGPLGPDWVPAGCVRRVEGVRWGVVDGRLLWPLDDFEVWRGWLEIEGQQAARRSRGRRVSDTSVEEAAAAARCCLIERARMFTVERLAGWVRSGWPGLRYLRRRAAAAATASLQDNGLTGRAAGARKCASLPLMPSDEALASASAAGEAFVRRQGGRVEMARDLAGVVRRVRRVALAECRPQDQRAVGRRFGRLARVLVGTALGDSLEAACGAAGFGWDPGRHRSRAFEVALRSSGVFAAARQAVFTAPAGGGIGATVGLSPDRRVEGDCPGPVDWLPGVGMSVPCGATVRQLAMAAKASVARQRASYVAAWCRLLVAAGR